MNMLIVITKDSPQQCTYIQHKTENIASSTVYQNYIGINLHLSADMTSGSYHTNMAVPMALL